MGTKKQIMKMLNIAEKTFYNWKNQKRPVIVFFEKYLSDEEISEFLETGMVKKLEVLKMQKLQSDDYARMSDIHMVEEKIKSLEMQIEENNLQKR